MNGEKTRQTRSTYRHGDLRRALLDAGIALAREGGPDAVVLREATRRVGVVPNAAYRHFDNQLALLKAVRSAAIAGVARSMEAQIDALGPASGDATYARARLRAVGAGYMGYALSETGLFRTAFAVRFELADQADPTRAGDSGMDPFQLLADALDRLMHAGVLPAEHRAGAEFLAWSAVHGMAMLAIDGPLRMLAPAQVAALGQRLLDMVEKGL